MLTRAKTGENAFGNKRGDSGEGRGMFDRAGVSDLRSGRLRGEGLISPKVREGEDWRGRRRAVQVDLGDRGVLLPGLLLFRAATLNEPLVARLESAFGRALQTRLDFRLAAAFDLHGLNRRRRTVFAERGAGGVNECDAEKELEERDAEERLSPGEGAPVSALGREKPFHDNHGEDTRGDFPRVGRRLGFYEPWLASAALFASMIFFRASSVSGSTEEPGKPCHRTMPSEEITSTWGMPRTPIDLLILPPSTARV